VQAAGLVQEAVPADELLDRATSIAQAAASKSRPVIGEHKRLLYDTLVRRYPGPA
jgi:enoyl-CoA hydratase/carnithine racemase